MSLDAPATPLKKKKRFAWEWLVVAAVFVGVIAMEGLPTLAFIKNQKDHAAAVERIYACRQKHGQTTPKSLIRYEMEANGPKAWRETAEKLAKACEG